MDLIPIDTIATGEDGTVRYYPDIDDAHAKLARLAELVGTTDPGDATDLSTLSRWRETEALYLDLDLLTDEQIAKARSKSPALKMAMRVDQRKKTLTNDRDFLTAEESFRRDLVQGQIRRVGNCRTKKKDGGWDQVETAEALFAALRRVDRRTRELVDDVYRALEDISHLEAGRGN